MKNILYLLPTIFLLLFFFTDAFACRNFVPESEAVKYITAAEFGQSVPGGKSCAEAQGEQCLCFDEIEGWDVAAIVDAYADDLSKPIYLTECPQGQDGCAPVGYEQFKSGKKLANDPAKLAAKLQREAQEEVAAAQKLLEKKEAKTRLKGCVAGIDAVSTQVAKVNAVRNCLADFVKTLED